MTTLRALHNHIIFEFEDKAIISDGISQFVDQTESGIEIVRHSDSASSGRWGYVVFLGPEAEEEGFEIGMRIFVEPLKWTNALSFEGMQIHRTDVDQILAVDDSFTGGRKKLNDHAGVKYQH